MKLRRLKRWQTGLVLGLAVIGAVIGIFIFRVNNSSILPNSIVKCSGDQANNFSCWQKHYQALVNQRSPEVAFSDIKQAEKTSAYVKSQCHQLAHVIGRTAAKKYPNLKQTYAHGDNYCWSGYYHGAIEAVAQQLGNDKILSQINTVCADFLHEHPYSFNHYNCVHGMGHGLMAVLDDDLFKSLDSCTAYEGSWQQQSCYSGVFMENVMGEFVSGHKTVYLKNDQPLYPCTAVAEKYKQQCYLMQTSHALKVEQQDFQKVFNLCARVESPFNLTCYQSLGRDASGQSNSNQSTTIEHCLMGQSYDAQNNCFIGAVKDFISYYHNDQQGLAMCAAIPNSHLAANCTLTAKEYYKSF